MLKLHSMLKIYPKTASMKIILSREARFIKLRVTGRWGGGGGEDLGDGRNTQVPLYFTDKTQE